MVLMAFAHPIEESYIKFKWNIINNAGTTYSYFPTAVFKSLRDQVFAQATPKRSGSECFV